MATSLPTNFTNDVLDSSMGGKRRYTQINNPDGTVSFDDATIYETEGSTYGATQLNATNEAINETSALVENTTNVLNSKLPSTISGFSVGVDGKPYITYKVGADSVTKKLDGDRSFEIRFTYYARWLATGSVNAGSDNTVTTIIRYDAETKSIAFVSGDGNGGSTGGGNGTVLCQTSLSNISITFNE